MDKVTLFLSSLRYLSSFVHGTCNVDCFFVYRQARVGEILRSIIVGPKDHVKPIFFGTREWILTLGDCHVNVAEGSFVTHGGNHNEAVLKAIVNDLWVLKHESFVGLSDSKELP